MKITIHQDVVLPKGVSPLEVADIKQSLINFFDKSLETKRDDDGVLKVKGLSGINTEKVKDKEEEYSNLPYLLIGGLVIFLAGAAYLNSSSVSPNRAHQLSFEENKRR